MNLALQAIASGVSTGSVYALISLSLVIVYKSTDVLNFAGGELVMLGAYVGLLVIVGFDLPYYLVVLIAPLALSLVGAVFDRFTLRRVAGRTIGRHVDLVPYVVATIGLSYLLRGLVRVVPYTEETRRLPPLFAGPPIFVGDVVLQRQDFAILAITAFVMVALWLFFGHTMVGKALRATSQNPRAAALIGIPVRNARVLVWALSSALAALAGVLLAPKLLMTPDMGSVVMLAFAAAVIGGFQSLPGCVVGGLILGVLQNLVGIFISPQAIAVTPFIVIMLILLVRPAGLFGRTAAIKV